MCVGQMGIMLFTKGTKWLHLYTGLLTFCANHSLKPPPEYSEAEAGVLHVFIFGLIYARPTESNSQDIKQLLPPRDWWVTQPKNGKKSMGRWSFSRKIFWHLRRGKCHFWPLVAGWGESVARGKKNASKPPGGWGRTHLKQRNGTDR